LLKHQRPVVSALYFERKPPFAPVFRMIRDTPGQQATAVPAGLFEAQYIGLGCALIEMEVLQKIFLRYNDVNCFAFEHNEGEDIFFCRRLHELGIPILVDTAIECGHVADIIIRRHHFDNAALFAPGAVYQSAV